MLSIINFVPKVQALDKSAATLAEIRRQLGAVRVISVISLTEKHQIDSIDSLVDLVSRVSDDIVFVGESDLHGSAAAYLTANGRAANRLAAEGLAASLNDRLAPDDKTVLLAPVGHGNGPLNAALVDWARAGGIPILGYFKSLHDEGMGLSTMLSASDRASGLTSRLRKLAGRLRQSRSAAKPGELPLSQVDWLMVFNQRHAQTIAGKAGDTQLIETGYQLLFPAWRDLVAQSPYCRTYPRGTRLEVVLFTRGETPRRPPEENVVPHANLVRLLEDIVSALDASGRNWHLRIKPHPIQDVDFLRGLIADCANIEIVYEAPALLAATADLAIATYSSTVVDTLAFGVPTIEYFFETPFFLAKHPTGSPFPGLGAMKARNVEVFRQCMQDALQQTPKGSRIMEDIKGNPHFSILAE